MCKMMCMHAEMVTHVDTTVAKEQEDVEDAMCWAVGLAFDALVGLDHLRSNLGREAPVVAVWVVPVVHQRRGPPATAPKVIPPSGNPPPVP